MYCVLHRLGHKLFVCRRWPIWRLQGGSQHESLTSFCSLPHLAVQRWLEPYERCSWTACHLLEDVTSASWSTRTAAAGCHFSRTGGQGAWVSCRADFARLHALFKLCLVQACDDSSILCRASEADHSGAQSGPQISLSAADACLGPQCALITLGDSDLHRLELWWSVSRRHA
jgi:hypothetical protein